MDRMASCMEAVGVRGELPPGRPPLNPAQTGIPFLRLPKPPGAQGAVLPLSGSSSGSPALAHTPTQGCEELREGDRGDDPVLGTASAFWPREEGGEALEASGVVLGGGQSRRQEVSKETPGFLTPTLRKSDSLGKAGTGEEGSARPSFREPRRRHRRRQELPGPCQRVGRMGGWGALPDPGASSVSPEARKGASPCPHLGDSWRPLAVTAQTEGSGLSLATNVLPGRVNLAPEGPILLG